MVVRKGHPTAWQSVAASAPGYAFKMQPISRAIACDERCLFPRTKEHFRAEVSDRGSTVDCAHGNAMEPLPLQQQTELVGIIPPLYSDALVGLREDIVVVDFILEPGCADLVDHIVANGSVAHDRCAILRAGRHPRHDPVGLT